MRLPSRPAGRARRTPLLGPGRLGPHDPYQVRVLGETPDAPWAQAELLLGGVRVAQFSNTWPLTSLHFEDPAQQRAFAAHAWREDLLGWRARQSERVALDLLLAAQAERRAHTLFTRDRAGVTETWPVHWSGEVPPETLLNLWDDGVRQIYRPGHGWCALSVHLASAEAPLALGEAVKLAARPHRAEPWHLVLSATGRRAEAELGALARRHLRAAYLGDPRADETAGGAHVLEHAAFLLAALGEVLPPPGRRRSAVASLERLEERCETLFSGTAPNLRDLAEADPGRGREVLLEALLAVQASLSVPVDRAAKLAPADRVHAQQVLLSALVWSLRALNLTLDLDVNARLTAQLAGQPGRGGARGRRVRP